MPNSTNTEVDSYQARLPALDGLRGLAILLVLAHNLQIFTAPTLWLDRLVDRGTDLGWVGVQLFFVLSGFLITRILMDTRDTPNYFRNFFARRALRIFPIYFLTLTFIFYVLPTIMPSTKALPTWPYWLYLVNWMHQTTESHDLLPHLWSLAIEEQFYLLWPFLLYRQSAIATWRLCLVIAVVSPLTRMAMLALDADPASVYTYTHCRMDALALGGAAAAAWRIPSLDRHTANAAAMLGWSALTVFGLGFIATRGYPRTSALGQSLGYSMLALSFALLVLAAACADRDRVHGAFNFFRHRWLRALGGCSYAMYLFHEPLHKLVGQPVMRRLGLDSSPSALINLMYLVFSVVCLYLMAKLSSFAVESPFLRMKSAFSQAPSSKANLTSSA